MKLCPFATDRIVAAAACLCAVLALAPCLLVPAAAQSSPPATVNPASVDPGPSAVTAANRAFEQAWTTSDKLTVDRTLEPEFTWITPAGVLLDRAEAMGNWPKLAALSNSGEVTERIYDHVALLQIHMADVYVLRVFVDEGPKRGWHLLHMIETVEARPFNQLAYTKKHYAVVPTESGVDTDCINPCRVVPVLPANSNERAALAAWQQMEIGAAAQDMKEWGRHVADEALIVDSTGGAVTKGDRIAGTQDHEGAARASNEAPPLLGARMFDLGNVVLMVAEQQPYDGQPFRATYVWVNRDNRYQMVVSYHTTIKEVPAFALTDQLDDP
jgi:hypothetical protein